MKKLYYILLLKMFIENVNVSIQYVNSVSLKERKILSYTRSGAIFMVLNYFTNT